MPPSLSRRRAVWAGVTAIGAISAGAGFWARQKRDLPESGSVAALWSAELKDLDGKKFSMGSLRGQALVVNFWATWCGPCVEEMPDFQRASQTGVAKKVKFVGIGIDYAAKMKPFAEKLGITYLLLEGGSQGLDLLRAVGNTAGVLPFTLIINSSGAVLTQVAGKMSYDGLQSALVSL